MPGVYVAVERRGRCLGGSGVSGVFFIMRRASTAFHSDLETGLSAMVDLDRVEMGIWGYTEVEAQGQCNFTG